MFGAPPQPVFNDPPRQDFQKQELFAPPRKPEISGNARNDKNIVESVMGRGFDPFLAGPPAQPPIQNKMNFDEPLPF